MRCETTSFECDFLLHRRSLSETHLKVVARREFLPESDVGQAALRKKVLWLCAPCLHPSTSSQKSVVGNLIISLPLHRVEPIVSFLFSPPPLP